MTESTLMRAGRDLRPAQQLTAAFRRSSVRRATIQLGATLLPLAALLVAMYLSLGVSYWLTLALAPLAAGFYLRTFIIMHDCAHGSFTPSRRANDFIGRITGVITLTPFAQWRREHALHHASSGDLERRGHGDIDTLTVDEYLARNRWGRLKYRMYRHPIVIFGLGPIYLFLDHRWRMASSESTPQQRRSVHLTNLVIVLLGVAASLAIGFGNVLRIYVPVFFVASVAGIWLFYVQHQFEGTYWEDHENWDYTSASLSGSSYYRLPRVLEWMTGRIGLHHIHHLDPKIPNYRLRQCHDETLAFHEVPVLTVRSSLRSLRLKLWDAERRRLVGFNAVRDVGRATGRKPAAGSRLEQAS